VALVEVSSNFTDVFSMTEKQQLNVLSMPFSLKKFSAFSSDDVICSNSTKFMFYFLCYF